MTEEIKTRQTEKEEEEEERFMTAVETFEKLCLPWWKQNKLFVGCHGANILNLFRIIFLIFSLFHN